MAAKTITRAIAPRVEFYSPAGGGFEMRIYDSLNNIQWQGCFDGATYTALKAVLDAGAAGTYIPKNVGPGPNTDGRLSSGGSLPSERWAGAA